MTNFTKIQSFDSEIIYNSEESMGMVKEEQNSFLNGMFEKCEDSQGSTRIKNQKIIKVKIIEKPPKLERVSKSGKWSGTNRINYYKAVLIFYTEHPYYKISWRYWKPQKFYPRMILFINRNQTYYKKSVIQTKSFDERQRKQYFQNHPYLDIIELSKKKLKEISSTDNEAKTILQQFQQKTKQKNQHMDLVEQRMTRLREVKYQVEELFMEVVGNREKGKIKEDSCFY